MNDLDDLLMCDRQDMIMRWRRAFGSTPPKHTSSSFLKKVLAHELQCKSYGDIPRRIEKQLRAVLKESSASNAKRKFRSNEGDGAIGVKSPEPFALSKMAAPVLLSPGMQLVREWNGRTWQVDVLEGGFLCKGKTYRSLSAVARMITGTRWSGPRFFGLRST